MKLLLSITHHEMQYLKRVMLGAFEKLQLWTRRTDS